MEGGMAVETDVPFVLGNGTQESSGGNNSVFYVTALELTRRSAAQAHGIPEEVGSILQSWNPASVNSLDIWTHGRNLVIHEGAPDQ
jgi:hypothetical protein